MTQNDDTKTPQHEWRLGPVWELDGLHEAICLTCLPKMHTARMPPGSAPPYTEQDYWTYVAAYDPASSQIDGLGAP